MKEYVKPLVEVIFIDDEIISTSGIIEQDGKYGYPDGEVPVDFPF